MPTYPVKNLKTGEEKELHMTMTAYDEWRKENPDWLRDYSDTSTMPGVGKVGEWQDKLRKKAPGWNTILKRAQKAAPRNPTIKTL